MADFPSTHLSDEQLARFQDGDLTPAESSHLNQCPECRDRVAELETAAAAWAEYRRTILDPALPPPPRPWRSLESLRREKDARRRPHWSWWAVPALAAAACLVVTVALVLRHKTPAPAADAGDLLARSVLYEARPNGILTLRTNGRLLIRPAVLLASVHPERNPDLARLERLFARAEYDWTQPLSARAFQAWRNALGHKRDTVSVIAGAYRVQTDAPGGVLQSASLTLRGERLDATDATFRFEGEELLEMGLAEGHVNHGAPARPPVDPPVETPATPADALRVLAALNAIGADAGEPIELVDDAAGQILVRGAGLDPARRQQVDEALRPLAHVRLDLDAAPAAVTHSAPRGPAANRSTSVMPAALRQDLENRLGGPGALQDVTDRVLESAAQAAARAHAIEVLAARFPAPVESALAPQDRDLLHTLLRSHLTRLTQLTARIQADLKPVLVPAPRLPEPAPQPWQHQVPPLVAAVQALDASLNQLLAGSADAALLRALPEQLARAAHLADTLHQGNR